MGTDGTGPPSAALGSTPKGWPNSAPITAVTAIARAPQNTTRAAPAHGRAPPTRAASHPSPPSSTSDVPPTSGDQRRLRAEGDGQQRRRGAHGKARGRRESGLQGPRTKDLRDTELVTSMARQGIVRHQLGGHLVSQARVETAADVYRRQLRELRIRRRRQLHRLSPQVSALRVGLRADRHVFPGGHGHRAGDEGRRARDQHARGARVSRRHTQDQARRGHDPVVGTEDGRPKPADLCRAMRFSMM